MNLIKTSKNKNHFILQKSQRTVVVVLTLFLFYQYLLGNKSKGNQTHTKKQEAILGKIISFQGILLAGKPRKPALSLSLSGATPHSQGGGGGEGVCLLVVLRAGVGARTRAKSLKTSEKNSCCNVLVLEFDFGLQHLDIFGPPPGGGVAFLTSKS